MKFYKRDKCPHCGKDLNVKEVEVEDFMEILSAIKKDYKMDGLFRKLTEK